MTFIVYIIYSKLLDRYYIGYTNDLNTRLQQHIEGLSTYTSKSSDWELKYSEAFTTRQDAHKREMEIKRKKSRRYIEWLIASSK